MWRALVNAPLVPFTDEELAAIAEAKGDPRPPRTHAEIEAMIAERARTER